MEYQNGNCHVVLLEDGTKHRSYSGEPLPEFPESIDLKVTNFCDAGCGFCHERSTRFGEHAPLERIFQIADGLPPGVEMAIGGGNPLDYPHLDQVLREFARRGLVSNLTVRDVHVPPMWHLLLDWQQSGHLHGVGISSNYPGRLPGCLAVDFTDVDFTDVDFTDDDFAQLRNVVWHVIIGLVRPQDLLAEMPSAVRLLILGYKRFGFGAQFLSDAELQASIYEWRYWLTTLMACVDVCSFDNLALSQLDVLRRLSAEQVSRCYMGDDGQFTMYVDAVRDEFAISSTSDRFPRQGKTTAECFQFLQTVRAANTRELV